jgi:hypothetical protein
MRSKGLRVLGVTMELPHLCSAKIITFPKDRRHARARQAPSPDKLNGHRVIQLGQWWWRLALGEVNEPRELARHYRQLAERCYRLAAIGSGRAVSEGFVRMGDDLAAKANYLEAKSREAKDLEAKDLAAKQLKAKRGQGTKRAQAEAD